MVSPGSLRRHDPITRIDAKLQGFSQMSTSPIHADERQRINAGRWFSSLSRTLRHDILRNVFVRRFVEGDRIAARGDPHGHWMGCAKGSVRVCSTTSAGRHSTFAYMEPGSWFGNIAIFDGGQWAHDYFACEDTTVLFMPQDNFRALLATHVELYGALMRLQSQYIKGLTGTVDDLKTMTVRDRLAKFLMRHARRRGVADHEAGVRLDLGLAQEELGRLIGASRQRVNKALRTLEKESLLRLDARGMVILDLEMLKRNVE
ncbi:cyclic nucleotide-binding domain-containing protein [Variovorax paradoxus]|uniref:Cyclic nucleotide-binding domain-containing protein n=2 Tax=Variovorax paradoxus TaxID=34073 RepID=A0A5Q0M691_VARPD|nr:cyclic nucleotide-binding domain-containing protein [Variovorax paradoxus]